MTLDDFRRKALCLVEDATVFGRWFLGGSWRAWLAVFYGILGLVPASEDLRTTLLQITGRSTCPTSLARTVLLVIGRGGGKSFISAITACLWAIRDYAEFLAPGELAVVMVIASDRRQARVVMRYIKGLIATFQIFGVMVTRETAEAIYLSNGVVIEVHTASFRSLRGYRVVCAICDEIGFWSVDGANPDSEILRALGPALARTPGSLLMLISSPYARRGELWRLYREHFGKDASDVLAIQASTKTMNPTFSQSEIDKAYQDDPQSAAAEYFAEFRKDVEQFITHEVLEPIVMPGRLELPPSHNIKYGAFGDFAGGAGKDSATLAIGHVANKVFVPDALLEIRPPFNPDDAAREFADACKRYRAHEIIGDHFAGEWPRERCAQYGVTYRASAKPKSDLYREALPILTSRRAELLDHPRLTKQLLSLERRTGRSGKDSIDHPPNGNDDCANSALGLLAILAKAEASGPSFGTWRWGLD